MWNRILLAIDQYDASRAALRFGVELAVPTGAEVRVLHIRELSNHPRVPTIERPAEAQHLVDEALLTLRIAGVGAEGRACSERLDQVAKRIVTEAREWECDAIVLGSRRLRGIDRLSGRGARERVLRLTALPVLIAPAPVLGSSRRAARAKADAAEPVSRHLGPLHLPTRGSR